MPDVELTISSLSKKGHGKSELNERSIEVMNTLPGERVLAEIPKRRGRKKRANLLKLLSTSPHRVEPRCPHAAICGGCAFQHLAYPEQLKLKEDKVTTLFNHPVLPIIGVDDPFYGRNKMEFTFSETRAGTRYLGLIMAGSRGDVFNLTECHMTHEWFAKTLQQVREWWEASDLKAYHGPSDSGSLRTLTLRRSAHTESQLVMLTVSGNPDYALKTDHLESLKECLSGSSLFVQIQQTQKGSPTQFYEMHLAGEETLVETLTIKGREMTFHISPTSFFQPQTKQAEKLFTHALDLLNPSPKDILFDLCCGTGTLALIFAPYVAKAIGIELNPYAAIDAQVNSQVNNLSNATFIKGDVFEECAKLKAQGIKPDIVTLDPPRAGITPQMVDLLKELAPKKILYISCNPTTQKENIEALMPDYQIVTLQPLDQFPHSPHIENIALLEIHP